MGRCSRGLIAASTVAWVSSVGAQQIWTSSISSDFNRSQNWQNNTDPQDKAIQFGSSGTQLSIILDQSDAIIGATFNANALARTFSASGNRILTIGSGGITNSNGATATQVFSGSSLSIRLGSNTAFTNNDASTGTLSFTSGLAAFELRGFTLTLGGSNTNANEIAETIANGTGTGKITKTGAGLWILSGTNSYTGATTINGGTLQVTDLANYSSTSSIGNITSAGLGAAGLVINGGTLRYQNTNDDSSNRLFTLGASGGTIEASGGGDLNLSGTGNIAMTGSGTRTLTLGGTSGDGTTTNTSILAANIVNSGADATSLTKADSGTWRLTGTNTYSGKTNINGGTLIVGTEANLGATPGSFVSNQLGLNGGTLNAVTGSGSWGISANRGVTLGAGGGTFDIDSGVTFTVNSVIAGTAGGGLTKSDTGTLVLNAAGTFDGSTTLTAGTLRFGINDALPTATALTINAGTLDLNNYNGTIGSLTGSAGTIDLSTASAAKTVTIGSGSYSGTITDSGAGAALALTKTGLGTLTLGGNNTYRGKTNINGGTLIVGTEANLGATPGSFVADQLGLNGGTLNAVTGSGSWGISANRGVTLGAGGGTFDIDSGVTFTVNSVIAGTAGGGLTKTDTGTLVLNAAGTFDGSTTLTAGTLRFGINDALPTATALTINAGTLDLNNYNGTIGSLTGSAGTIDLSTASAAKTLTIGSGSYSGTITDSGAGAALALTKTGLGTLTLGGNNTYSGKTNINGGTLIVGTEANLGSTPGSFVADQLGLNGGTLNAVTGSGSWGISANRGVMLGAGGGTFDIDSGVTFTVNSVIAGTAGGGLTKSDTGTLVLNAVGTYDGSTTLNAGTLRFGINNALPAATALTINGGTLDLNNYNGTIGSLAGSAGTIDLSTASAAKTLTIGSGSYSGTITDSGAGAALALTKTGLGTLTLGGNNTYSGTTTLSAGTLVAGSDTAFGTGGLSISGGTTLEASGGSRTLANVVDATGDFTIGGSNNLTLTNNISLGNGARSLNISNTGTTTFDGAVSLGWSGAFTKTGTGRLEFTNGNSFDGVFDLQGGTLALVHSGALGGSTWGNTIADGATLELSNNIAVNEGQFAVRGIGQGGVGAIRNYADTNSLSATLTFGDATRIVSDSGQLTLSGQMDTGSYEITFTGAGNIIATNQIYGGGSLLKTGAGTVTLSGSSTYSGLTNVTAGTLAYGGSNAIGDGAVTVNGATAVLALGANHTDQIGTLTVDGGGSITGSGTSALTVHNSNTFEMKDGSVGVILTGSAALNKTTSGTVTLSAANTYAGATTIDLGTLRYGTANALPTTTALTMNGGTLDLNTFNGSVQSLNGSAGTVDSTGTGTKTFTVGTAGNWDSGGFAGTIQNTAGSLSLAKVGNGTLTLSGINTFSGTTTIDSGVLKYGSSAALPSGTAVIMNGGTLDLDTFTAQIGSLAGVSGAIVDSTGGGSKVLTVGDASSTTFSGTIQNTSGTLGLTKIGSGSLTLDGTNTYGGVTTINEGTLRISQDASLGAAPGSPTAGRVVLGGGSLEATDTFTLNSNRGIALTTATSSTITVASGETLTYNGSIAGAGNISFGTTSTGTGMVALGGFSTLSGSVDVAAGTLRLDSDFALGSSNGGTTVSSGATLMLMGNTEPATFNGTLTLSGSGATGMNGAIVGNGAVDSRWDNNIVLNGNATAYNAFAGGYLALGASSIAYERLEDPAGPPDDANSLQLGSHTLTLAGTGTIHLNSRIEGTGGLTIDMAGAGDIVQTNANWNTYTGLTLIKQGTFLPRTTSNTVPGDPDNPNFFGITGAVQIGDGTGGANTATLLINNEGERTSELLAPTTTIELNSDGLLKVGAVQSIGALTFNGGRIDIFDPAGQLYLNGDVLVNDGTTSTIDGTGRTLSLTVHRLAGDLSPNASRIFDTDGTGSLAIHSRIVNGSIVKDGTGTLTLHGDSTSGYEGATTINSGILAITRGTALGQGGTDDSRTQVSGASPGTLQVSNNITIVNEKLTLNGAGFGGNGALQSTSGSNVWNGIVTLGNNARIQSDAGSLLTIGGNMNSTANGTLTVGGAGDTTITGIVGTGSGGLIKNGDGTLILSGENTFTGATVIDDGIVRITQGSALGGTGGGTTVSGNGAALELSGGITTNAEGLALNGTGIGGDGALRGVAGANTFAGTVALNSAALITADDGASLTLSAGTTSASQDLSVGSSTRNGNVTIAGMANGNGALVKNGSGTLTITGGTATVGTVAMNGGTLNFNSTTTNTGTVNANAGTTNFNSTTTNTGVVNANGGQINFAGVTANTGDINLDSSNVDVAATTVNAAEISANSGLTLTIATGGTVNATYTGTIAFDGTLAGGGTFVKDGAGTLEFTQGFTATNLDLTLTAGTLAVTGNFSVDTLTLAGGTFSLADAQFEANAIHITGNTILDFNESTSTFLRSSTLLIDDGVTVTVRNWVSVANTAALSTIWYVQGTVNDSPLGGSHVVGGEPLDNIHFADGAYYGQTATWVSGGVPEGWFGNEIRPTPEPATYGAIFLSACFGLLGWRRFRANRAQ